MMIDHISILHFDGKREATRKRLQKLKAAGFIAERPRRIQEPAVLFLTGKAFSLLKGNGILVNYPAIPAATLEKRAHVSDLTLRHELEVMDAKAAFHSAISNDPRLTLDVFSTWPLLNQFEGVRPGAKKSVLVKPDGFIQIHETEPDGETSEHTFFLEVDRSTEVQETLVERAGCYLDYYKSGGFAERNRAPRSAFKEFPFRVLFVMKTAERRNNTAERLLQGSVPILTQVLLTTAGEVTANPLGAIWIRPVDYRSATAETAFDPATKRRSWEYKRQPEREALIDLRVKKIPLIE